MLPVAFKVFACFFISSLAHELGHIIAALIFRLKIIRVALFTGFIDFNFHRAIDFSIGLNPFLSYVVISDLFLPRRKISHMITIAAGPLMNLLLVYLTLPHWNNDFWGFLCMLNIAKFILNILPLKNSDGGRLVDAWKEKSYTSMLKNMV